MSSLEQHTISMLNWNFCLVFPGDSFCYITLSRHFLVSTRLFTFMMKRSSTPPPNFPNNSSLLHNLASSPSSLVKPRRRVSSHPVFPSALPSFESITRSASAQATILKPQRSGLSPLTYSMRIGKSHSEITILLVGAISRRVNNFSDEELAHPTGEMIGLLKGIRTNLKAAIAFGLQNKITDLISSYLQVVIMSSTFVQVAISGLFPTKRPVQDARTKMYKFASQSLDKKDRDELLNVASVTEFLANASVDIVVLALWKLASEADGTADHSLPLWQFARDERV
ncbi:hypothetical protein BT69DRAFT_1381759 [Atractiella rhizophila]|nr:hypothetical protein BT69DRAFT_1381759 [Atractiella rhizophila]